MGPRDSAGRVEGALATVRVPHLRCLLERLLGEFDADLLGVEQLPERVTQLGGVVEQARPGVRLAGQAPQNPLRDLRRPSGR
jgi:hypothetical protein